MRLLELLSCRLQLVDDVDVLRASRLALAALDAVAGPGALARGKAVVSLAFVLTVERGAVQALHDAGDGHANRAVLHAVVAAGARHGDELGELAFWVRCR